MAVGRTTNLVMLGSNYGGRPDPNLTFMADYLLEQGYQVCIVANEPDVDDPVYLRRGSIRSAVCFLRAQTCLYTHSLSDVLPVAHKLHVLKRILGFPQLIFLQHGVIGLKSRLADGSTMRAYIRSLEPTFDQMIVSSELERDTVAGFGVAKDKLNVTGLPRFDGYTQNANESRDILIFFTWQAEGSLSAKLEEVLSSSAIGLLHDQGYNVVVARHDMQRLKPDTQTISPATLSDAIRNCELLITDDSSAAWDVFYRGGEVIFYQPSLDWLRDDEALIHRRCADRDELLGNVQLLLAGKLPQDVQEVAKYKDADNCQRVAALIKERG